jgi:hypothetical protein
LRLDARLLDEVRVTETGGAVEMRLRLWQGRGKLAVELVMTGSDGPVLDAAAAPGLDGIADWLEAVDPWAGLGAEGSADTGRTRATGIAEALWAEAVISQRRADFQWLVGEALYRWQGPSVAAPETVETAA